MLKKAAEQGNVKEEGVWRVSRKGNRFKLRDVRLFNVTELDGEWLRCHAQITSSAVVWWS